MHKIALGITTVLALALLAVAQPPGGPPGRPGGPPRGFPGDFPAPPGFHLMTALDTDRDGKISTPEIERAVAALQKLDKNSDGKLSAEEIGWPPAGGLGGGRGPGGFPGFGGPGGPGNPRPQRPDADGARPDSSSGPRTRDPAASGKSEKTRFFSFKQIQSLDRNNDGKIVQDEIPKGLQERILARLDTSNDGLIDEDELAIFRKQSAQPKSK